MGQLINTKWTLPRGYVEKNVCNITEQKSLSILGTKTEALYYPATDLRWTCNNIPPHYV
jgi:hypothetical protein